MVATKLSLADFLSLDTGPEVRCEFVDGEMVEMPPESEENVVIGGYLVAQFLKILPFEQVRQGKTELVVAGRVRIPDLMVLSEELVAPAAPLLKTCQRLCWWSRWFRRAKPTKTETK
jgi:Uma2 family endonuclease